MPLPVYGRVDLVIEHILQLFEEALDKTEIVSDSVFKSMSDTQTPQGVLAIVKMPHYEIDEQIGRAHV